MSSSSSSSSSVPPEQTQYAPDIEGLNVFLTFDSLNTQLRPAYQGAPSTLYAMFVPRNIFHKDAVGLWSPLVETTWRFYINILEMFRANVSRVEPGVCTFAIMTVGESGFFVLMYEGVTAAQRAIIAGDSARKLLAEEQEGIAEEGEPEGDDGGAAAAAALQKARAKAILMAAVRAGDEARAKCPRSISFGDWVDRFFRLRTQYAACPELDVNTTITNMNAPLVSQWAGLFTRKYDRINQDLRSYLTWSDPSANEDTRESYDFTSVFSLSRAYAVYAAACATDDVTPIPRAQLFSEFNVQCKMDGVFGIKVTFVPHVSRVPTVRVYTCSDVRKSEWSRFKFPADTPPASLVDGVVHRMTQSCASGAPEVYRSLIRRTIGSADLASQSSTVMHLILAQIATNVSAARVIPNPQTRITALRDAIDAGMSQLSDAIAGGPPGASPAVCTIASYARIHMRGDRNVVPGAVDIASMIVLPGITLENLENARLMCTDDFDGGATYAHAFLLREATTNLERAQRSRAMFGTTHIDGSSVSMSESACEEWLRPGTSVIRGGLCMTTNANGSMPGSSLALYNVALSVKLNDSAHMYPQFLAILATFSSGSVYPNAGINGYHIGMLMCGPPGTGKTHVITYLEGACIPGTIDNHATASNCVGTTGQDNAWKGYHRDEANVLLGGSESARIDFEKFGITPSDNAPPSGNPETIARVALTSYETGNARAQINRETNTVGQATVTGYTPGYLIAATNLWCIEPLPAAMKSRLIESIVRGDAEAVTRAQMEAHHGVTDNTFGSVRSTYTHASIRASQVLITLHSLLVRSAIAPAIDVSMVPVMMSLCARFVSRFGIDKALDTRRRQLILRLSETFAMCRAESVARLLGLIHPTRAPTLADVSIMSAFAVVGYEDVYYAFSASQAFGDRVYVDMMRAIRDMLVTSIDEQLADRAPEIPSGSFGSYIPRSGARPGQMFNSNPSAQRQRQRPQSYEEMTIPALLLKLHALRGPNRGGSIVTPTGYVRITSYRMNQSSGASVVPASSAPYMGSSHGDPIATASNAARAATLLAFAHTLVVHPRLAAGNFKPMDMYSGLFWPLHPESIYAGPKRRTSAIMVADGNIYAHISLLVLCDYLTPETIVGAVLADDVRVPVLSLAGTPCAGGYRMEPWMLAPPTPEEVTRRTADRVAMNQFCNPDAPPEHELCVPPMRQALRVGVVYASEAQLTSKIGAHLQKVYPYVPVEHLTRSIAYPPNTTRALYAAENLRGYITTNPFLIASDYIQLMRLCAIYYATLYVTFDGLTYRVRDVDVVDRLSSMRSDIRTVTGDDAGFLRWAALCLQCILLEFARYPEEPAHSAQQVADITPTQFDRVVSQWDSSGSVLPMGDVFDLNEDGQIVIGGIPSSRQRNLRKRPAVEVCNSGMYANWGREAGAQRARIMEVEIEQEDREMVNARGDWY